VGVYGLVGGAVVKGSGVSIAFSGIDVAAAAPDGNDKMQ
jgi:hypothetical protein